MAHLINKSGEGGGAGKEAVKIKQIKQLFLLLINTAGGGGGGWRYLPDKPEEGWLAYSGLCLGPQRLLTPPQGAHQAGCQHQASSTMLQMFTRKKMVLLNPGQANTTTNPRCLRYTHFHHCSYPGGAKKSLYTKRSIRRYTGDGGGYEQGEERKVKTCNRKV